MLTWQQARENVIEVVRARMSRRGRGHVRLDRALFDEALPAFDKMGKKTMYLGEAGGGAHMKLIINMIMGGMLTLLCEGLALGEKSGLKPAEILEALDAGALAREGHNSLAYIHWLTEATKLAAADRERYPDGLPPPFRLTAGGELEPLLPAVFATPLGLHPELHLSTFSVRDGDRLLFYTDGLLEARDRAGRFFRLDEQIETLRQPSPQAAVDGLLDRLRAHTRHRLDDDIAVLLVELALTNPDPGPGGAGHAPLTRTVPRDLDDQLTATVRAHRA